MKRKKKCWREKQFVPLADLAQLWDYAEAAPFPRCDVPPADWWRTLLVLAWTTAMRRRDLWALRWDHVDLGRGSIVVRARRASRRDVFPLHPVAVAQLERVKPAGGSLASDSHVLRQMYARADGWTLLNAMHRLQDNAGIENLFWLEDVRHTALLEMESVSPGLGSVLGQLGPRLPFDPSDTARYDAVQRGYERFPIPANWKGGRR